MKHSESLANIAVALSKAQAGVKVAVKDSVNPHLKSKYADLGSVFDACREVLADNGLSVVQMPVTDEPGYIALETMLLHASGEFIASRARVRLQKDDPQGAGSGLTYLRRYALSAAMGIVADEDDDGHAASRGPQKAQPQPARTQSRPAPTQARQDAPPQGADPVLNNKQAESLHARLGMALKGTEWDGQDDKAFVAGVLGFKISSFTELKLSEARQLTEAAEKLPKIAA